MSAQVPGIQITPLVSTGKNITDTAAQQASTPVSSGNCSKVSFFEDIEVMEVVTGEYEKDRTRGHRAAICIANQREFRFIEGIEQQSSAFTDCFPFCQ